MNQLKTIASIILIAFCTTATAQYSKVTNKDLKKVYKMMKGHFTSELQSKRDTSFFNIHLNMTPLWKGKNEYYLYVEQATALALNKPYRQRVYHLYKEGDSTIVSKVFEIKNPSKYVNAHHNKTLLDSLQKSDLIDRQGCAIYLHKQGSTFVGATPGKECLSSLRGATYATSEVIVSAKQLLSWDRGWSKEDKQVWGATISGYEFVKQH
jgi:CpeT protein